MNTATRIHPETGDILRRDVRPIEFTYKNQKIVVDMPGWYPDNNDEGIFTHEDLRFSNEALRIMKARYLESQTKEAVSA